MKIRIPAAEPDLRRIITEAETRVVERLSALTAAHRHDGSRDPDLFHIQFAYRETQMEHRLSLIHISAPIEWVKAVRKICDEHGILMICDEVQCGWARSGKMFASQYFAERCV